MKLFNKEIPMTDDTSTDNAPRGLAVGILMALTGAVWAVIGFIAGRLL